jgi:DNA-binding ferritin-like protein (Dps family)
MKKKDDDLNAMKKRLKLQPTEHPQTAELQKKKRAEDQLDLLLQQDQRIRELEKELEGILQEKQADSTSQAPPTTSTTTKTSGEAVPPTVEAVGTAAPDASPSVEELTKAVKAMELQVDEIKKAKEKLAELDSKYTNSKMTVAEQGREIKAQRDKIKALEKELNLETAMADIKRILWDKIGQSIKQQWRSIKIIHEQMDLMGQAQAEIQKAKTVLGNKTEQANRMIDFLNRQEREELAAIGIPNRIEAVLSTKKAPTLRNYIQTVERKFFEMQADVEEYKAKMGVLQAKGLPSLLSGAGKLISLDQMANRMATTIENQIIASGSTSEQIGPPTGQSLYDKLEGLFFIENEVNHLFETPPNFYRYTEADETLIKIRRHQMPKEDWLQAMLQILPR